MNKYSKLLIRTFLLLIISGFTFKVNAGCFPDYRVYTNTEDKIVYLPVEGFNRELQDGPIYKITDLIFLDIDSKCGGIDISSKKKFTIFDLSNQGILKYIVNFVLIIFIYFLPIFLYGYIIFRKTNHLFIRTFIFFIPLYIWFTYIISKFFGYSLIS